MLQSSFVEAQTIRLAKLLDQKWSLCMAPYGFNIDAPQRKNTQHDVSPMICSSTLTWFWAIVFTLCLFLLDPHQKSPITSSFSFTCHSYLWINKNRPCGLRPRLGVPWNIKKSKNHDKGLRNLHFEANQVTKSWMICCCLFWCVSENLLGRFLLFWLEKKPPSKNHQWWCNQKEQTMVSFGWRPKGSFQPNSTNVVLLCVERRFYRAQVRNTHLFCLVPCCCSELRVTLFSLRNPAFSKTKIK